MAIPPARLPRIDWPEEEIKLYQLGTKKLREEGRLEGRASTLLRLLTLKFGELAPDVSKRISSAPRADLERWTDRVLTATSLDDLLAN